MKTVKVLVPEQEFEFLFEVEEFQPPHVVEALAQRQAEQLIGLPFLKVEIVEE